MKGCWDLRRRPWWGWKAGEWGRSARGRAASDGMEAEGQAGWAGWSLVTRQGPGALAVVLLTAAASGTAGCQITQLAAPL